MSKLLNEILSRENMLIAYRKVISNKGASGVDGVTVEEIKDYVNQNWKNIKKQIETRRLVRSYALTRRKDGNS